MVDEQNQREFTRVPVHI